jgi:hypothetical protein
LVLVLSDLIRSSSVRYDTVRPTARALNNERQRTDDCAYRQPVASVALSDLKTASGALRRPI